MRERLSCAAVLHAVSHESDEPSEASDLGEFYQWLGEFDQGQSALLGQQTTDDNWLVTAIKPDSKLDAAALAQGGGIQDELATLTKDDGHAMLRRTHV